MNNILIIEDEKSVSDVIKAYLQKEVYGVYSTENGLDGIEIFRKERIDLIILDLMLPDIDGEEVCKILRKISFEGNQLNSCNNGIVLPSLNIEKDLKPGENVIESTLKDEDIQFSCWM